VYKLILHHTYKAAGQAVDLTPYGHHGFRTGVGFSQNGMFPGSGALIFNQGSSDVRVPVTPVWQQLIALKIEVTAYLDNATADPLFPVHRLNLVEGEMSFAFFVNSKRQLVGTFLAPATAGGAPTWHGADSHQNAPDGVERLVPLNQWVRLTYEHDGFSTLRLYIDDVLVAENTSLIAGVPAVQMTGTHIGHWPPNDPRYTFEGMIDEVKIWKYDPDFTMNEFFCRIAGGKELNCWRPMFEMIAGLLSNPETSEYFIDFMACIERRITTFVRDLLSSGTDTATMNDRFAKEFLKLWCSGYVDSKAMQDFLYRWFEWISKVLGPDYLSHFIAGIQDCIEVFDKRTGLWGKLISLQMDCDPAFSVYLGLIEELYNKFNPDDTEGEKPIFPTSPLREYKPEPDAPADPVKPDEKEPSADGKEPSADEKETSTDKKPTEPRSPDSGAIADKSQEQTTATTPATPVSFFEKLIQLLRRFLPWI
tara:strand:- start:1151 stop:2584 length:1434 start_codon:yes stop_codon:yes gene_type:complete